MQREIKESDWKALKRLHPLVLERFCERVLSEIERVQQNPAQNFHHRYIKVYELIKQRDRELARVFDELKRSNALAMLAQMRAHGLLMDEEFSRLSAETRAIIEALLGNRSARPNR